MNRRSHMKMQTNIKLDIIVIVHVNIEMLHVVYVILSIVYQKKLP